MLRPAWCNIDIVTAIMSSLPVNLHACMLYDGTAGVQQSPKASHPEHSILIAAVRIKGGTPCAIQEAAHL
jgi:hypothetical protein